MNGNTSDIESRTRREKSAWNEEKLEQGFKRRIWGAFENPHSWKLEAEREKIIREKCADAVVLDYGCSDGYETKKYLEYGARLVSGIDISDEAIARAKAAIASPQARFVVGDAHNLPFDDQYFNLVVGRAILHHLDLRRGYSEIARVLKPGGLALFVEPLIGNPLAKLVRWATPHARTKDERPLDHRDIRLGDVLIGTGKHHYSGFFSAPLGAAVSLCGGGRENWLMRLAAAGDDLVEKTSLKYWGRLVFLSFRKPDARASG